MQNIVNHLHRIKSRGWADVGLYVSAVTVVLRALIGCLQSDVEWRIHNASKIPAPGQYGAPKVGSRQPPSRMPLLLIDYLTEQLPAPGGGKFNKSNPKSDVEMRIYNARSTPVIFVHF